jgi:transcriptional regulator with XRE-family HTH domain
MPGRFGEKLQHLRGHAALSQSDLARQLGDLTQSHLSYLEAGHKLPSLNVAIRLADFFGVPVDYLLRDELPITPHGGPMPPVSGRPRLVSQLGPRVRSLRRELGISQQELAQRLSATSRPFISLVENGRKTPSPEVAVRLADILGVSVDELLTAPDSSGRP